MSEAFNYAVRLLARREHSAYELATKLSKKGYGQEEINEVMATCQRLGLQDDARFVELLCRTRIHQGYGPLKIRQELQTRKIDNELIDSAIDQERENWLAHALTVWYKKYKQDDVSFPELQKRQRFLLYRGFPSDIIANVIKELKVI
ncbi:recombination regulator RecX [Legionella fairfieldensis]|uniref:recombination regulator RecX n=1 Tax=Legionella fairfieldensis TaxID=45064 RepID=UPI0004900859|nr:recombination regulator RecX [Legionella fairfieldensis]